MKMEMILIFVILAVFGVFIFAIALGVKLSESQMMLIGFILAVCIGILIYLLWMKNRVEDGMKKAFQYITKWWLEYADNEKLQRIDSRGYSRFFGTEEFFGFGFMRKEGVKAGQKMCIVAKRVGTGFSIVKFKENANEDDFEDPFVILQSHMKGAPVPSQPEPYTLMAGGKPSVLVQQLSGKEGEIIDTKK